MNCQQAYAAHGCIGNAVSVHGALPMTGLNLVTLGLVALVFILCGITIRLGRPHG